MANLIPISTHVQDAKDRLIEQYKSKSKVESLIQAFVQEIQVLENTFFDLCEDRTIDTAVGINLDRLGAILGQTRVPGQSDDDYRLAIKTKVVQNVSQGEPERLIDIFKIISGADYVLLSELYPAGFGLSSSVVFSDPDEINALFNLIERIAPAAVRFEYIGIFDADEPFAFDGGRPEDRGFGTTGDPLIGGKLGTLVLDTSETFAFSGGSPLDSGFGTTKDPLVGGGFDTL